MDVALRRHSEVSVPRTLHKSQTQRLLPKCLLTLKSHFMSCAAQNQHFQMVSAEHFTSMSGGNSSPMNSHAHKPFFPDKSAQ
uniref:Uncharacterized protein n=1 Tax=Anguilla anguilla TaxID=7936 RepID=A0A0E9WU62_ANGAN